MIYDSRREPPLPLGRKHLLLDWNLVPKSELEELKNLLEENRQDNTPLHPAGRGTVFTMSWRTPRPFNQRLLHFRKYFVERSIQEIDQELHAPGANSVSMQMLFFPDEYVEDENGNRLDWLEMMDRAMGGPVLILGDPRSVLRLGPANLKGRETWEQRDSDLLQQFIRVIERLSCSDWAGAPVSLTWSNKPGEENTLLERVLPTGTELAEVFAWMRQLYSSDDLFNHAVNLYLRYVDHVGKFDWVREIRSHFNKARASAPSLTPITEYTRQQLLDLLAYGARVLHRKSDNDAEAQLAALRKKYGDAHVAMAVNSALKELLIPAVLAYHPIKQDFQHWVTNGLVPQPKINDLDEMMVSER